ncbi:HNH endonuclease [Haloarcula amylovorans]|uniref:HNH endonuclease n=1 Tax=Haloarcula amylovorans TaxID=2562280 RepID=UPI001ADDC751|nr:HNH endonuclease [Halomicroarcula amylolytica]
MNTCLSAVQSAKMCTTKLPGNGGAQLKAPSAIAVLTTEGICQYGTWQPEFFGREGRWHRETSMSTENYKRDNESDQSNDTEGENNQYRLTEFSEARDIVLKRDGHKCTNCGKPQALAESLDIDHIVSRGAGGSERISNLHTLCRQCHDAKHEDATATSIEWMSTGMMDDYEFQWFRQFMNEIFPALARQVGVRISPYFGINSTEVWRTSIGDISRLDQRLSDIDNRYSPIDLEKDL